MSNRVESGVNHALEVTRGGSKLALSASLLLTAIAVATVYMTQPLFGLISSRFAIAPDAARYAFTWPLLTYAGIFFVVGPLSDRVRAPRLAGIGGLGLALSLYAASQPSDFRVFTSLLALSAACAACVPAASFAFIARNSEPKKLGLFFGLAIASTVIGVTLGRAFGAVVAGTIGLPGLYKISSAVVGVATAFLIAIRSPDNTPSKPRALTTFIVSTMALLRNARIVILIFVGTLLFVGYLGALTFLTFHLQLPPFSMATKDIGWISTIGLIAVVGAPISGALSSRFSPYSVAIAGLAVVVLSIAVLFITNTVPGVILGLILLFLGVFSCQPSVLVLLARETNSEAKGAVSSFYLLSCLLGGGLSSIILGPFWSSFGWEGVSVVSAITVTIAIGLVLVHQYLRPAQ